MAKILSQRIDPAGYIRCLVAIDKTEAVEFKFRKDEDHQKRTDEEVTKLLTSRAEAIKPPTREKLQTLDGTVYYADELQPVKTDEVTKAIKLEPSDKLKPVAVVVGVK